MFLLTTFDSLHVMYFFIFYLLVFNALTVYSKNWVPRYDNEDSFYEPFDYVNEVDLPDFERFGKGYDWVGIAGESSSSYQNVSYVAFSGTRKNHNGSFSSAYAKQSGIIVLCSTKRNIFTNVSLDFVLDCKKLEEKYLKTDNSKYFGANVRSAKSKNDTVAFVYCDPLWVDTKSDINQPSGKCKLSVFRNSLNVKNFEFKICDKYKKCLGGFSVDLMSMDQNFNLIFGLPFDNSTILLKHAESFQINRGQLYKGNFFNFGYSVVFSEDGNHFIASPSSDEHYPFVQTSEGNKIVPTDLKSQIYGGFGSSMDTVNVGNGLYGVIIGAPYQSRQKLTNVGAVYLACKGHEKDMVYGENQDDYFGYAVARLGDIDFDGSEEFVVSSPSLNFDKPGKIYIYKTTKDCKISKVPLQIHESKIKGFGISISRGFDIDFNGMPDFFVTALGYQKPMLFKMPDHGKVTCTWVEQNKEKIFVADEVIDIKIALNSPNIQGFDNYFFQVAIDYLNKEDQRFKLISSNLSGNSYIIQLQTLMDVQDMDLRQTPLKVAVHGIRKCKLNQTTCYLSKVPNIDWLNCDRIVKLPQNLCSKPNCVSDINMTVNPDSKGSIIYFGEQKDYQRQLEITINNKGPDASLRTYLSINSKPDLLITNVNCINFTCKSQLTTAGQKAKIIVKERLAKRVDNRDDLKIVVDILYNRLENVTSETSVNLNIWGINDDNYLVNNHQLTTYAVLFKPNLTLSSKKTKEINIDSRLKPPYLEPFKRVEVSELGTELKYSYIIENRGPALKNVQFKFHFPHRTETDKFILYVMDKIRLSNDGSFQNALPSISNKTHVVDYCQISTEIVNPLNLNGVENVPPVSNRLKRAISNQTAFESDFPQTDGDVVSNKETKNHFIHSDRRTVIECNRSLKAFGVPVCAEVTCQLNDVPANSEFIFDFRSWLFTKTFFDSNVPDLTVIASLQSNVGDLLLGIRTVNGEKIVGPVAMTQNVLFNKMKIIEKRPIPLWPIIVAVIIGLLLLVIIIVIANYCGFFKRKRLMKEGKYYEKVQNGRDINEEEPLTVEK